MTRLPPGFTYSPVSVSRTIHPFFLRQFLTSNRPEDFDKCSWLLEQQRAHPDMEIRKLESPHPMHGSYGVFATGKIAAGEEIGEYVGELQLMSKDLFLQSKIERSDYCWQHEIKGQILLIDAKKVANELAFINDYRGVSESPNVKPAWILHKGVFHFCYEAVREILPEEEVLVDYGSDYWKTF